MNNNDIFFEEWGANLSLNSVPLLQGQYHQGRAVDPPTPEQSLHWVIPQLNQCLTVQDFMAGGCVGTACSYMNFIICGTTPLYGQCVYCRTTTRRKIIRKIYWINALTRAYMSSIKVWNCSIGKVVRTPSGVYGRSLSLFQWREATWELSLPPGQDVSLTQGTSPAWWLVLILQLSRLKQWEAKSLA